MKSEGAPNLVDERDILVNQDAVVQNLTPGSIALSEVLALRLLSAVSLFFGLFMAPYWYRIDERIAAYRAALQRSGA